jgi:hypothetical protein
VSPLLSFVSFALPTVAGYAAWAALLGRPRGLAAQFAAIGTGFLLGAVGLGAVLAWFDGAAIRGIAQGASAVLVMLAAFSGLVAWRGRVVTSAPACRSGVRDGRRAAYAIATSLVLLVAFALLALQAWYLPTLGWDAWNAWLAKPKAWFHVGALVDAVSPSTWAGAPRDSVITATGWPYPEALPRYVSWLAAMAGDWNESIIHLAWPFAWAALGCCIVGYLRLEGVAVLTAVLAAAGVLLLPMFMAHAALAGYVDLWIAAILLLANIHLYRWWRGGGWRDAVAALVFALLLPALKAEGAVWMLCVFASAALARLPLRWGVAGIAAALLLWAVFLPWGGLQLPVPGLGWVRFGWGEIEMPKFGTMVLSWQSVGTEVFQTLFLLPNWLLLWYVAPVLLWLGWREIPGDRGLRALAWFLALGYAFLFVLFFFTDASAWAENFTSVNRVLMHAVPTTVYWLSLLWARRARRDRSDPRLP